MIEALSAMGMELNSNICLHKQCTAFSLLSIPQRIMNEVNNYPLFSFTSLAAGKGGVYFNILSQTGANRLF
jgi:hypothetical protein